MFATLLRFLPLIKKANPTMIAISVTIFALILANHYRTQLIEERASHAALTEAALAAAEAEMASVQANILRLQKERETALQQAQERAEQARQLATQLAARTSNAASRQIQGATDACLDRTLPDIDFGL